MASQYEKLDYSKINTDKALQERFRQMSEEERRWHLMHAISEGEASGPGIPLNDKFFDDLWAEINAERKARAEGKQ